MRWLKGALLCLAILTASSVAADDPRILVAKLLRRIPRSDEELAQAHAASKYATVQLAPGTRLAPADAERRVWYDVTLDEPGAPVARDRLFRCQREPVLCFGTQMSVEDQAELPLFTSGAILDRVDGDRVNFYVRVQRDAADGVPYLHYRPEAAVARYGEADTAQEFATLQQNALAEVKSLGLFVKQGTALSPETLRTLVISMRGQLAQQDTTTGEIQLQPSLEMLFVRARPAKHSKAADDRLELHAFATSDARRRLHYLKPFIEPEQFDQCGIQSTVRITEYELAGQYPSARAARRIRFRERDSYSFAALDAFAEKQGMQGDALDNLTAVLDAIIDGKVAPK